MSYVFFQDDLEHNLPLINNLEEISYKLWKENVSTTNIHTEHRTPKQWCPLAAIPPSVASHSGHPSLRGKGTPLLGSLVEHITLHSREI